jgi:hypothetical protein
LVSSTEQLQHQTEIARVLTPMAIAVQPTALNSAPRQSVVMVPVPLPQSTTLNPNQTLRFRRFSVTDLGHGGNSRVLSETASPQ